MLLATSRVLILLFIVSTYTVELKANPATSLGRLLHRVVTQQWQSYSHVLSEQRAFFMYNHWIKHLFLENFKGCLLSRNRKRFPHTDLHHRLGERLLDHRKINLHARVHPHRKIPNGVITDGDIDILARTGFVEGHFQPVRGTTQNHKIFITFHDNRLKDESNQKENEDRRIKTAWFLPIEQALFPSCTEEYRRLVALLPHWTAYSRFSLGFVPAGTEVNLRIGLVAPQSLPALDKTAFGTSSAPLTSQNDVTDMERSLANLRHPVDRAPTFFEFHEGGGMQVFIGRASGAYLIPLDALYVDGQPYNPTYSTSRHNRVWQSLKPGESSHLLDPQWNKAEINIPRALGPEGLRLLSRKEQREWEDVLRVVRN